MTYTIIETGWDFRGGQMRTRRKIVRAPHTEPVETIGTEVERTLAAALSGNLGWDANGSPVREFDEP